MARQRVIGDVDRVLTFLDGCTRVILGVPVEDRVSVVSEGDDTWLEYDESDAKLGEWIEAARAYALGVNVGKLMH